MQAQERTVDRGPVKVFVGLLAVVGVVVAVAMWTSEPQPAAAPPPPAAPPDHSLTNEEALTRFKELDQLRLIALRDRDAQAARQLFTSDSPSVADGLATIRKLRRTNVLFESSYDTKALSVLANSGTEVTINQEVVIQPRFVTESGKNVTAKPIPELRTVEWSLRFVDGNWLLHEGKITASRRAT